MKSLFAFTIILFFLTYTSSFFVTNKKHIEYSTIGEGKPIVLIHPFPTDSSIWKPQQEGLSDVFQIITIDMWGFGKSSDTDGSEYHMSDYADEINDVLTELNIEKAIIGGESMGGWVALSFLEKYPEKVLGLILSNTNAIAQDEKTIKADQEAIEIILKEGPTNYVLDFLHLALSENATPETREFLKKIFLRQRANGIISGIKAIDSRKDLQSVLAATDVLVLVITSDLDKVLDPKDAINMSKLPRYSQLVVFENIGHISNLERSIEWNQAVKDCFINF